MLKPAAEVKRAKRKARVVPTVSSGVAWSNIDVRKVSRLLYGLIKSRARICSAVDEGAGDVEPITCTIPHGEQYPAGLRFTLVLHILWTCVDDLVLDRRNGASLRGV